MSRQLRIEYPGAFYHVMSRGNARQNIFYNSKDYKLFLDILVDVADRYNWQCYGYCLMPNHYHLLLETPNANLSRGMRQLNGVFTQKINIAHRKVGHVLQGRYKAVIIEKQNYLGEVVRYIALNPVRAHLVGSPEMWPRSSYAGSIGGESIFDDGLVLGLFDINRNKAKEELKKFVHAKIENQDIIQKIKTAVVLGSLEFVDSIKKYSIQSGKTVKEIKNKDRFFSRPTLEMIFSEVNNKQERNTQIVKANVDFGYAITEIADYIDLHYSVVSRIIKANRD